jgi:hypothetical protein
MAIVDDPQPQGEFPDLPDDVVTDIRDRTWLSSFDVRLSTAWVR